MHVAPLPTSAAPTSVCLPAKRAASNTKSRYTPRGQTAVVQAAGAVGGGVGQRAAAALAAGQQRLQNGLAAVTAASRAAEQLEEADQWVEIGRIGPPHGVRGEMKVQPLTDFPEERLGTPGPRWLQAPAPKIGRRGVPPADEVELEWGRSMISKGSEVWLVKLADVDSPEEAALLRGHTLLVPASARQPLEDEDEFYVQELVGLRVFLRATGEEVGHVADVFDGTGTHDVLRIQLSTSQLQRLQAAGDTLSSEDEDDSPSEAGSNGTAAGDEVAAGGACHVLLPFAKAMVPVIDLAAKRLEITPPEGLLELASPSNLKRPRRENRGKRERRKRRPRGQPAVEAGTSSDSGDPAE